MTPLGACMLTGPTSSGAKIPSPPPSIMAGPPIPMVASCVAIITSQQPSRAALPAKQRPERYCQLAEKRKPWHTDGMKTNTTAPNYKGFRFPPEIISHAVWLYFRFSLSFRDVEELLAQRGIVVTYETVRQWCLKFGQSYANEVRRRPHCGDTWHLDE